MEWYDGASEVYELATWLNDQAYFCSTDRMVEFLQSPFKWERERELMLAYRGSDDDEFRQACVDALDDDNVTARDLLSGSGDE